MQCNFLTILDWIHLFPLLLLLNASLNLVAVINFVHLSELVHTLYVKFVFNSSNCSCQFYCTLGWLETSTMQCWFHFNFRASFGEIIVKVGTRIVSKCNLFILSSCICFHSCCNEYEMFCNFSLLFFLIMDMCGLVSLNILGVDVSAH